MNIGIFTDTYYPQINGVAHSIMTLEKELIRRGHTVYIFTTTNPGNRKSKGNVYRLPSFPFVFSPTHRFTFFYPPRLLFYRIRKFKLDIIHTHTEFALGLLGKLVSGFYKIPTVHTYHTMYEEYTHYILNGHLIKPKSALKYVRFFCNKTCGVIAPAGKPQEALIKCGVNKPIYLIPTGQDFTNFDCSKLTQDDINEVKKEVGLNLTDPVIVSVCRVAKEKSIDNLLVIMKNLLEKIPEVKLLIVGDGPHREELEETARSMGISRSVIFAGARPWNEIAKYYKVGDVFTSASISETQGLTYIEAMATKTPLVVKFDKNLEGLVVNGVNGYSFDNEDEAPELFYRALTNKEETQALANHAFETIQPFSSEIFGEKVENFYFDAIDFYQKRKELLDELK